MLEILLYIGALIFTLGVLITFHEFGHYWVARRCGVKILRFSIGFGRPLYKRLFGPDRSELVIAALPLGGYVKMLDEREGEVQPEERARAFNHQPVSRRVAIVVAGPAFNFLFAVFAYWLMYLTGITGLKPVVASVAAGSFASQSGLMAGDEIIQADGEATPTWTGVVEALVAGVVGEREVRLLVRSAEGSDRYCDLDMSRVSVDHLANGDLLQPLGLTPRYPRMRPTIREVLENSAAASAGLRSGDQLQTMDGMPVTHVAEWVEYVQGRPDQPIAVEVRRAGQTLSFSVTPSPVVEDNGARVGRVGTIVYDQIIEPNELQATQTYSLAGALVKSLRKTGEMSVMTLRLLGKMITGEVSVKHISGPISIAQYAGRSAGLGLAIFLGFLAVVSLNLGLLNLLPIPILDGGHLLYCLVEIVKGSPLSESAQAIGQQVGLVLLIGLIGIALYNDIIRLIG
jgi:regulator of sigma E protease